MTGQNDRLGGLVEKVAIWLIGALVSVSCYLYIGTQDRINEIDTKVTFLYQDKVSKTDLREEINRLHAQIHHQNESNKSDIIARIDMLTRFLVKENTK